MREINFLPAWYPKVIRQRMLLRAQLAATAAVVAFGLVGLLITQKTIADGAGELARARLEASRTIHAVHQLDEMLDLQRQLVAKQATVSELGLPVELSRVLSEMGACTPREVTFTDLDVTTREQAPATIAERAIAAAGGRDASAASRRLEVALRGIAPTEAEVTTFWSRLIQRPFLSDVRLVSATEKTEGDHKMRVFEITLDVGLDPNVPANPLGAR